MRDPILGKPGSPSVCAVMPGLSQDEPKLRHSRCAGDAERSQGAREATSRVCKDISRVLQPQRICYCPFPVLFVVWRAHTRALSHTLAFSKPLGNQENHACIPGHDKRRICVSPRLFCFSSISFPLPDLPLGQDTCMTNWNLIKTIE